MRTKLLLLAALSCASFAASAQLSINIGVNLPAYPQLVPVPGYPVYYAPSVNSNYFFYDGMYWVYQDDNWYASDWYNGPWGMVNRDEVPLFVLRVPVRYYREAPSFFSGWQRDAAPHWDQHWGNDWARRHNGWDQWNHSAKAVRSPLPTYQRNYAGARYPQFQQQQALRSQNYHYQPHDAQVRQQAEVHQHFAPPADQRAAEPAVRNGGNRNPAPANPAVAPHDRTPSTHAAPADQRPPADQRAPVAQARPQMEAQQPQRQQPEHQQQRQQQEQQRQQKEHQPAQRPPAEHAPAAPAIHPERAAPEQNRPAREERAAEPAQGEHKGQPGGRGRERPDERGEEGKH